MQALNGGPGSLGRSRDDAVQELDTQYQLPVDLTAGYFETVFCVVDEASNPGLHGKRGRTHVLVHCIRLGFEMRPTSLLPAPAVAALTGLPWPSPVRCQLP